MTFFDRGFISEPGVTRPSAHAASVCVLPNGDLIAAWFAGSREGAPDVAIVSARYTNGGWTEPRVVVDTPGKPDGNNVLWPDGAGVLRMWYVTMEGDGWATCPVREVRSHDGGVTWGDPSYIREPWGWMVRNEPIVHRGRIIMPMYDERHWFSFMLLSGDRAQTWARSERLLVKGVGLIQPAVAATPDGGLFAMMRSSDGHVYASRSADGESWSAPERTAFPNPNSAVELIGLRSGQLLAVFNPVERGRTPLRVALSRDGGRTWPAYRDVETSAGEYSYPTAVQMDDGMIHLFYTHERRTIAHVRFEEAWVSEG